MVLFYHEAMNIHLSTASTPAGNSHQYVLFIFLNRYCSPTIALTWGSSWALCADHITKNTTFIECSVRYKSFGRGITAIYKACAFFALSVTYDGLRCHPQNWTGPPPGHLRALASSKFGVRYGPPSIRWTHPPCVVLIFWCKASWHVCWVKTLFQHYQRNVISVVFFCFVTSIVILVRNNLFDLQVLPFNNDQRLSMFSEIKLPSILDVVQRGAIQYVMFFYQNCQRICLE